MLQKTFRHTDGISIDTEKLLWENGIDSWEEFLIKETNLDILPQSKINKIKSELFFSKEQLENGNIKYFSDKLDSKEHWRLSNHWKICFLDIETTGLSRWTDDITMIGIYDGENPKIYIKDHNLDDVKEYLKQFDIVVTFNGKQFDIPFIEYKFGEKYDFVHLDLRFMLKEFGLSGGLKKIEKDLGISRSDMVADVDGREAVRLWRRYKNGDEEALKILKMYNIEDIVNLKHLLEWYIDKKVNGLQRNQ